MALFQIWKLEVFFLVTGGKLESLLGRFYVIWVIKWTNLLFQETQGACPFPLLVDERIAFTGDVAGRGLCPNRSQQYVQISLESYKVPTCLQYFAILHFFSPVLVFFGLLMFAPF